MRALSFGYKCQECGEGVVREQIVHGYKTKIKGLPLTVEEARIGVCDRCGSSHFDPAETMRWRDLINQKYANAYLQPLEIREIIQKLGFSMEQFANFIGCTRQSLYNWLRPERTAPQSRMADLFMRLLRESHSVGQVDVLKFLSDEASKLGFSLGVPNPQDKAPIVTFPRRLRTLDFVESAKSSLPQLAADTDSEEGAVVLVTEEGENIARIFLSFTDGMLKFDFNGPPPFVVFDAEIYFEDGTTVKANNLHVKEKEILSICRCRHTEDQIDQVVFTPRA